MNDIVYILKNNINDEELIYSIRSVVKNFPYNNIWFAGGTPQHLTPDFLLPWTQQGQNKWFKIRNTLELMCKQPNLTEDFWLFNDDFFVMQPIFEEKDVPTTDGSLQYLIKRRTKRDGDIKSYATELFTTRRALEDKDMDSLNFEIHLPILMNKTKVLQTIRTFPTITQIRSLYGNQHKICGLDTKDRKITDLNELPPENSKFLSTSDESFRKGKVGEYIRSKFPEKSKYEGD